MGMKRKALLGAMWEPFGHHLTALTVPPEGPLPGGTVAGSARLTHRVPIGPPLAPVAPFGTLSGAV